MNLELIRQRWQALDVPVRAGVSQEAVEAFERRYRVRLPEDVRRFYVHMDGMEYGSTDEALYCFWPLSEVATVPEKLAGWRGVPGYGGLESTLPEAESYFVFADHSIWLHVYAMRLAREPGAAQVIWIADAANWAPLAHSFGEFLERYTSDPWSILAP